MLNSEYASSDTTLLVRLFFSRLVELSSAQQNSRSLLDAQDQSSPSTFARPNCNENRAALLNVRGRKREKRTVNATWKVRKRANGTPYIQIAPGIVSIIMSTSARREREGRTVAQSKVNTSEYWRHQFAIGRSRGPREEAGDHCRAHARSSPCRGLEIVL